MSILNSLVPRPLQTFNVSRRKRVKRLGEPGDKAIFSVQERSRTLSSTIMIVYFMYISTCIIIPHAELEARNIELLLQQECMSYLKVFSQAGLVSPQSLPVGLELEGGVWYSRDGHLLLRLNRGRRRGHTHIECTVSFGLLEDGHLCPIRGRRWRIR